MAKRLLHAFVFASVLAGSALSLSARRVTTTIFLDSGTDATQGLQWLTTSAGAVTSDTTQPATGPRAYRLNTGAGPTEASAQLQTIFDSSGDNDNCLAWAFEAETFTSVEQEVQNSSAQKVVSLNVSAGAGGFAVEPVGVTAVAGSATATVDTPYHLALCWHLVSTTSFTIKLYVNGTLDVTVTQANGTMSRIGADRIRWRIRTGAGTNKSIYLDDIYIDDRVDASSPGVVKITNKRAFADGTTTGWSTFGSGSGYGSGDAAFVNEQPLSVTNGVNFVGAGSAVTEEFTVEGASVGDVDTTCETLVDLGGWVYASSLVSETGQIKLVGSASNISLTSTNTLFKKYAASGTYPAGGTDIGIISSTGVTTFSLYEAGILVAFTDAACASGVNPALLQNIPLRGGGRVWR